MPRSPAIHYNSPKDDEHTACGRKLAKVKWDIQPAHVTCIACKRVLRRTESPYSESNAGFKVEP